MINNKQMTSYIIPVPPLLPGDSDVSAAQITRPKVIKGAVTQLTSITTGVTVNDCAGVITTVSSTLAAGSTTSFVVTNSSIGSDSQILVCVQDYSGTTGLPYAFVDTITNTGTFSVTLMNEGNAALNGILKVGFLII